MTSYRIEYLEEENTKLQKRTFEEENLKLEKNNLSPEKQIQELKKNKKTESIYFFLFQ
jgi:uncharacterized protein YkuJ